MPEWSNGTVLKTVVQFTVPGVRIPSSPFFFMITDQLYTETDVKKEEFVPKLGTITTSEHIFEQDGSLRKSGIVIAWYRMGKGGFPIGTVLFEYDDDGIYEIPKNRRGCSIKFSNIGEEEEEWVTRYFEELDIFFLLSDYRWKYTDRGLDELLKLIDSVNGISKDVKKYWEYIVRKVNDTYRV